MKTTKKVCNKLFGIFNLEDRGTDVIIMGLIIVLLLFFSAFLSEPAKSIILATSCILVLIFLSAVLAIIVVTLLAIIFSVVWDLLLFIKDSVKKHGFLTVVVKAAAAGFLICSSYVLIKALQPGTGLYVVFRTEYPNPFVVVGSLMIFSLLVLVKKL